MLGIPVVLALVLLIITVVVKWSRLYNEEAAKTAEVRRLMVVASPEVSMADVDFAEEFTSTVVTGLHQCAVCFSLTSTRCSRCKAVRYCSSKCQILHWRQGHKDECHPRDPPIFERVYLSGNGETNGNEFAKGLSTMNDKVIMGQMHDGLSDSDNMTPCPSNTPADSMDTYNVVNIVGPSSYCKYERPISDVNSPKMVKEEDKNNTVDLNTPLTSSSIGLVNTLKKPNKGKSMHSDRMKLMASNSHQPPGFRKDGEVQSLTTNNHSARNNGLKSSVQNRHVKACLQKKTPYKNSLLETFGNHNTKGVFHYDTFMKLYSSNEVELRPFGLLNCGNSCYANVVLQCLAYTRPLTSYLFLGLHSKECWKEGWCFFCEFEHLILEARKGHTPLSPIQILSNVSHLGHGKEEDAHEFLRYAVDTMQSVSMDRAGFKAPVAEETTLIGMTFGGYLHSKIKCMKCHNKSEKYERMMDISVEIHGDIRTLEQALKRFTASEILEGDNKYHCSRCKSYQKAKKKLSVFQAPNILTIMLKRFEAGNFSKLDKLVQFPTTLNMSPYMHGLNDRYPQYSLYAVVVHLDVMNAAFSGHYVCYVKNYHEGWFKIDDSVVISVDLKRVLSEEAYMLLYARDFPRPPSLIRNSGNEKFEEEKNLEAIPKGRHKRSSDIDTHPFVRQRESSRNDYAKKIPSDVEEWVTHSVKSISMVDSSSEVSSLFSYSEQGTCSTPSANDSEDFSDYLFGSASR